MLLPGRTVYSAAKAIVVSARQATSTSSIASPFFNPFIFHTSQFDHDTASRRRASSAARRAGYTAKYKFTLGKDQTVIFNVEL